MPDRINLDDINRADKQGFVAALGDIFEDAPWVAERAFEQRPFVSVGALHDAMMAVVRSRTKPEQIAFVAGHPDLAGKAARAGKIAPASVSEQAGLGLDRLSDDEFARFETMNAAYRARFKFPFVICARRQTRDAILAAFERRLANETAAELDAALAEISYITRLRLADRVEGPGMPLIAGHLSTHVLDTYHGRPAAGVLIELFEIGRSGRALLLTVTTNTEGRTDRPLIGGVPLRAGTYELLFHIGDYFRASGVALTEPPFLDLVAVRFGIAEPEGRYHVPITATPWSYATYRGS